MHFYGIGWQEVQAMPFSVFIQLFKCASMLDARNTLRDVRVISFPNMQESDRNKFLRDLRSASDAFMFKPLKDFQTVVANLAKRMMNVG